MRLVRVTRWLQVALALAITLITALGLIWPGAMSLFVLPFLCIYVAWAGRAVSGHRFSVALAFVVTLLFAGFFGLVGTVRVMHALKEDPARLTSTTELVADASGAIVHLPKSSGVADTRVRQRTWSQSHFETLIFALIAVAAWLVVILHLRLWTSSGSLKR